MQKLIYKCKVILCMMFSEMLRCKNNIETLSKEENEKLQVLRYLFNLFESPTRIFIDMNYSAIGQLVVTIAPIF
jgi:hypothetical protein